MKNYLLKLADDTLIMGQRLAEWCGKGPYLEEDIALTNIALDYLGQANQFYSYASELSIEKKTPDDLAFLRYEHEYVNAALVELPNGDYARTLFKVYFFALYQSLLYQKLQETADERLNALAVKSLKEVRYHLSHSRMWLEIFARGTSQSGKKLTDALEALWEYTGGLFESVEGEEELVEIDVVPSMEELYSKWKEEVQQDFTKWKLEVPTSPFMQKGSRTGQHTEYFGYILCELQYMQRAYPGCEW